jgi:hypothetical protein
VEESCEGWLRVSIAPTEPALLSLHLRNISESLGPSALASLPAATIEGVLSALSTAPS